METLWNSAVSGMTHVEEHAVVGFGCIHEGELKGRQLNQNRAIPKQNKALVVWMDYAEKPKSVLTEKQER